MTGGMDNPVDVAFTAAGEPIVTATFVKHPAAGLRDGLVHAVYGGVFGKPHAVIDGHKRTGELMPVLDQLGPAVPAGLTRYVSAQFGGDVRDHFFAAMVNLRKVKRHVSRSGVTPATRVTDATAPALGILTRVHLSHDNKQTESVRKRSCQSSKPRNGCAT